MGESEFDDLVENLSLKRERCKIVSIFLAANVEVGLNAEAKVAPVRANMVRVHIDLNIRFYLSLGLLFCKLSQCPREKWKDADFYGKLTSLGEEDEVGMTQMAFHHWHH